MPIPLEAGAVHALRYFKTCLTLAVCGGRNYLPPEVLGALDLLESQFMEMGESFGAGQLRFEERR
jgi:hypothetical protein